MPVVANKTAYQEYAIGDNPHRREDNCTIHHAHRSTAYHQFSHQSVIFLKITNN